jgi:predicted HicB family RNase H-like nuclease
MNTMRHGKYLAVIDFDEDAGLLHGEIVNLNDIITFQGQSVSELRKAFQESIEDYLEACAEFGKEPEKPFTGNFVVRISPEVHRSAVVAAKSEGKSLNKWVSDIVERAACGESCIAY